MFPRGSAFHGCSWCWPLMRTVTSSNMAFSKRSSSLFLASICRHRGHLRLVSLCWQAVHCTWLNLQLQKGAVIVPADGDLFGDNSTVSCFLKSYASWDSFTLRAIRKSASERNIDKYLQHNKMAKLMSNIHLYFYLCLYYFNGYVYVFFVYNPF